MHDTEALRARAADAQSEAELRRLWSTWRAAILHRLLTGAGRAAAPQPATNSPMTHHHNPLRNRHV